MDWLAIISALFFAGAFFWTNCPCCGLCASCTNGDMPPSIQVVINGLTNGTCSDCDDLNATYILSILQQIPSGTSPCIWAYALPVTICGVTSVNLRVGSSGTGFLSFQIVKSITEIFNWRTDTEPGRRDCHAWSNYSLPPVSGPPVCDYTSSTCLVTKL